LKKKSIMILAVIFFLVLPVNAVRTPSTTQIPPISGQSAGVIFLCNPFQVEPGSVVIGANGFIRVECPTNGALVLDGTLTQHSS